MDLMEMEMEMASLGDDETIHAYQDLSDISVPQADGDGDGDGDADPDGDADGDADINDLEPYKGMVFESEEAAKAFYNSYARRTGFSTRAGTSRRSKRNGALIQRSFVCAKEGSSDRRYPRSSRKRPRAQSQPHARVGCKAVMVIKSKDPGRWVVSSFVKEHSHPLVPPDMVHCLRSHRHISGTAKSLIDTLQAAGIGPSGIMSALIKECGGISNVGFTDRDCRNYMRPRRPRRTLGGDTQLLLDYLRDKQSQDPEFFYAVQDDADHCLNNVFWADPKARTNYTYFGDAVTFDTTYRSNRYRLPFAPFTGVNHHGQPVLFGCALVVNESEESFVWLFETWLAAMSGRPPVSITTDHDRVIRLAVTQVFPEARHRFCKWHIFKECQEKLSDVLLKLPILEAELHKCVNLTESIEEFESCWLSLIDRHDLREHEWLQAIYADRRQWVPVYLRDTFFAEMSITQRSDSINSYFDGYVNASTTLPQFLYPYEKALETHYEKEVKADYDTINTAPVLKTPSPMEKQAAELYTRKLFMKFQEELVETLSFSTKVENNDAVTTYRVAKYGESDIAYFVSFDVRGMKATCSCQMFEFSGILCRHILAVFRVTNVLTLPSRYVLKRWTRNAKSGVMLEDHTSIFDGSKESLTVRYNNLRHEALKYVDDGYKSLDIYNVAMGALQEAANKIALAEMNGGKVAVSNRTDHKLQKNQTNTASQDHRWCSQQSATEDDQDRKIYILSRKLERAQRKCGMYRANLLTLLKGVDEQKLQLSVKVENIKLEMKNSLSSCSS